MSNIFDCLLKKIRGVGVLLKGIEWCLVRSWKPRGVSQVELRILPGFLSYKCSLQRKNSLPERMARRNRSSLQEEGALLPSSLTLNSLLLSRSAEFQLYYRWPYGILTPPPKNLHYEWRYPWLNIYYRENVFCCTAWRCSCIKGAFGAEASKQRADEALPDCPTEGFGLQGALWKTCLPCCLKKEQFLFHSGKGG